MRISDWSSDVCSSDLKLEALHVFAGLVVRNRGWVSDADVDAFFAAGYTQRNVLEVVLGVATKVMSNYTNHIVHTPLDAFMQVNEWRKQAADAAAYRPPPPTPRPSRRNTMSLQQTGTPQGQEK